MNLFSILGFWVSLSIINIFFYLALARTTFLFIWSMMPRMLEHWVPSTATDHPAKHSFPNALRVWNNVKLLSSSLHTVVYRHQPSTESLNFHTVSLKSLQYQLLIIKRMPARIRRNKKNSLQRDESCFSSFLCT